MRAAKGSDFEREVCKRLSKWWTQDLKEPRDDVFWRTSQSGGRATQRMKKGKDTSASHGDITAIDPIGAPLLKMFTIELKRGSSYSSLGDLLDFKPVNNKHPWVVCLMQALRSHEEAWSKAWLMICKRDHRLPVVYLESRIMKLFQEDKVTMISSCAMRFRLLVRRGMKRDEIEEEVVIIGLPLETFLSIVTPAKIISHLKL